MTDPLFEHIRSHPVLELQDIFKFLYQRHMGPGHAIPEETVARERLIREWEQTAPDPELPLYELLGGGMARLNLAPCRAGGFRPDHVLALFLQTACTFVADPAGLREDLARLPDIPLPFPQDETAGAVERYLAAGCPAISHSETYRKAWSPAYRIVREQYLRLLPVFSALDALPESASPHLIAIDGPCASGKTTLATDMGAILRCPVVHMDDFFLRPEMRTQERLAEPGGNVDRERVRDEVLLPLKSGREAVFRPWNCHTGAFDETCTVPPVSLVIVEGSYALHPELRNFFDLRIFLETDWPVRRQRLQERCDEWGFQRFLDLWIPLEDRYFAQCQVRECSNLILNALPEQKLPRSAGPESVPEQEEF